ncbi:hypothetical protein HQ447_21080 [bacterium]|nr:hypothetical protein [bacterium]
MAGISGLNGNIAISGAIGGIIKSWTANFTRATTDITGFTNATRNRAIGIIDVTGSMTGSLDSATSPTVAFTGNTAAADITLTAETGNTLVFKAIIDSFTVGVAVDGEATFSANYAIASTAATFAAAVAATWS